MATFAENYKARWEKSFEAQRNNWSKDHWTNDQKEFKKPGTLARMYEDIVTGSFTKGGLNHDASRESPMLINAFRSAGRCVGGVGAFVTGVCLLEGAGLVTAALGAGIGAVTAACDKEKNMGENIGAGVVSGFTVPLGVTYRVCAAPFTAAGYGFHAIGTAIGAFRDTLKASKVDTPVLKQSL